MLNLFLIFNICNLSSVRNRRNLIFSVKKENVNFALTQYFCFTIYRFIYLTNVLGKIFVLNMY